MRFKLCGKYSKHIGFVASLLGLQHLVRLDDKTFEQPNDVKEYYKNIFLSAKTLVQINRGEDYFLSYCNCDSWEDKDETPDEVELQLDNSIEDSEILFYKVLSDNNIIQCLFPFGEGTIQTTIEHFFKRKSNIAEVRFHAQNPLYQQNTFLWMIILCFCSEGRTHKHHNRLWQDKIQLQYKNKRIAVMLCGHVRKALNHIDRQQLLFKYPHVDVFIHTWDDYGLKNHRPHKGGWLLDNPAKINVDFLKTHYSPKALLVENNASILPSMSLVGKIEPIFLYNGQAHDDATKYINSQLYGINKCFELVKEYEKENGFKYDAVMKFRLDYIPFVFDMDAVMSNIEEDVIWFPHAHHNNHRHFGGGGGCKCCDACGEHGPEHTNDLCDIWYYAKRDLMETACQLFHVAPSILEKYTQNNINIIEEMNIKVHKNDPFVYVISTANIENHVVCYYPERLLREHLRGISCKSCDAIRGGLV